MRKITYLLRRHKGFTLVEMVIAIAVFAVLTSMVIMVLGSTVTLSHDASEAERDLNNVVENVVEDNTRRVYGSDSHTLTMGFKSASDFTMSYSTVDGAKNFIECPSCKEKASSIDYMTYIYDTNTYKNWTPASAKNAYKVYYWFRQSAETKDFKCPSCGYQFDPASTIKVKCESCEATGLLSVNVTNFSTGVTETGGNWDYDSVRGNWVCKTCKGEAIVQLVTVPGSTVEVPISESTAETNLMVSGISANALRYGTVYQRPKKVPDSPGAGDSVQELTVLSGVDQFTATLTYSQSTNATKPGIYTLSIPSVPGLTSTSAGSITFILPDHYLPDLVKGGNIPFGTDVTDFTSLYAAPIKNASEQDGTSEITIYNLNSTNSNGLTLKFTLSNYKNGNSFEDDYKSVGEGTHALTTLWFGCSGNSISCTGGKREESNITLDSTLAAPKTTGGTTS